MKEGDIAKIVTDNGGHLYKGVKVRVIKVLSPKNEKPILVEPLDGIMGGWFDEKDLEVINE